MLSKHALKEILQFVKESGGSFIVLEEDQPRLAVLDFQVYEDLVKSGQLSSEHSLDKLADDTIRQTLLITGGAGVFASRVVKALHNLGHKLIVVDDLSTGDKNNLPQEIELVEADLKDTELLENIFDQHKFDAVVHLAEKSGHKESFLSPELYFIENIESGIGLLKLMAKHGVNKIIYRSSVPISTPYFQTKKIFENILDFYHQNFGINSISLRLPGIAVNTTTKTEDPESCLFENPVMTALHTALGKIPCMPLPSTASDETFDVRIISEEDAVSAFVFALGHLQDSSGCMVYEVDDIKTSFTRLIEESMEITKKMIPTIRSSSLNIWFDSINGIKPLSHLGWQPKVVDLNNLIRGLWVKQENAVSEETETLKVVKNKPTISELPADDQPGIKTPVSLSELLSGKFTPFIKPHNS